MVGTLEMGVGEAFVEEGDGEPEVASLVVDDDCCDGAEECFGLIGHEFGMEGDEGSLSRDGERRELSLDVGVRDEWEGGREDADAVVGEGELDATEEAVVGVGAESGEAFCLVHYPAEP